MDNYRSHLDNDCYKIPMGSFYWHFFKDTPVEFAYKCRDPQINLTCIHDELHEAVEKMSDVLLKPDEQKWIFENTRITQDYLVNFFRNFRFNSTQVKIEKIEANPGLAIKIVGPVQEVSLWEVPLMNTISELYFRKIYGDKYDEICTAAMNDLERKITEFYELYGMCGTKFLFSEFGSRRRLSFDFQDFVVGKLLERMEINLVGTSNMFFAKKYGIKAVGTQAHEMMMFYQGIVHPEDSQKKFMRDWIDFYRGWLGIALTDTLGSKKWDKDFTKDLMIDYNGQRHDSGDPYAWGIDRIKAYERESINPKEKILMFSDNLSLDKAWNLSKHFGDKINVTHGIGTFFTNHIPSIPDHKALNQVIKLVRVDGRPVAKLSDDPSKAQCEDKFYLDYLKHIAE